jgi:hypothetical protein
MTMMIICDQYILHLAAMPPFEVRSLLNKYYIVVIKIKNMKTYLRRDLGTSAIIGIIRFVLSWYWANVG